MNTRRNFLKTLPLKITAFSLLFPTVNYGEEQRAIPAKPGSLNLSYFPYELKLRHAFGVAGNTRTSTQGVQVRIELDGVVGYGEASMPPYLGESTASVLDFLQRVDLTPYKNVFALEDILDYVDGITANNTAAKAAVDIALHDLVGKLTGLPWHKIWGLNPEKTPSTMFTIGIDTPDVVRQKTEEAPDFELLKVKLGRDKKSDQEMIMAVRAVTDKPIAVDVNQGWTDKIYALEMINWLHEQGIVLVEQPMPKTKWDDIAWITERSPIPVMADESLQRLSDVPRLKGIFSGVNIKLMKCTGMREAWKILNLARSLDMKVMIGCMTETSCAISAAAQLSPAVDWADLDGNLLIANDIFDGVKVSESGKLLLNDLPGIGVTPLEDRDGKF